MLPNLRCVAVFVWVGIDSCCDYWRHWRSTIVVCKYCFCSICLPSRDVKQPRNISLGTNSQIGQNRADYRIYESKELSHSSIAVSEIFLSCFVNVPDADNYRFANYTQEYAVRALLTFIANDHKNKEAVHCDCACICCVDLSLIVIVFFFALVRRANTTPFRVSSSW
jgi:hypothetical protein